MADGNREENAGDMLERLGMDGGKWAAEFRQTALQLGYSDMDDGWLIGWFCNAIMAGYDRATLVEIERVKREARNEARREAAELAMNMTENDNLRGAILALMEDTDDD